MQQRGLSDQAGFLRSAAASQEQFLDTLGKLREAAGMGGRSDAPDPHTAGYLKTADGADAESERRGRRAAYHARMKQKYERAAARPWLTVAPDPPPP